MLVSHQKTSKFEVSSLTEEKSSNRVERANFKDSDVMTAPVQRMKQDVVNSLYNVFTEVHKTYENIVMASKMKIRGDPLTAGKSWKLTFSLSQSV